MKRYNTPHRSRVVKTRMTEEEYAEFAERLSAYNMSQAEFIIELCDFLETWCWFLFAFGGALAAVLVFYIKSKLSGSVSVILQISSIIGSSVCECVFL